MTVANCKRCGQMFHRSNREICPQCVKEEDAAFLAVRAYLKEHRETTMQQLVDATGVDEEFILDMIHDGRLYLGDFPNITYECERCGGPTHTGRLCSGCTKELSSELESTSQQLRHRANEQRQSSQMHAYRSR